MNDLIIDGNSLYARCWFGSKENPEETAKHFVNMVLQLLDADHGRIGERIHRTLFAWDGKPKTNKPRGDSKPPLYHSTRYKLQEDLLELFDTVHGFHPEYEADDVVATATFNSKAEHITVASGDKDLMQLAGGKVTYYDFNSRQVMSTMSICQKFSVKRPIQSAIALAIIGDRGDGVPGIHKWGPKKVELVFKQVSNDMRFCEALEAVKRQIPNSLLPQFLDSLDKTLLFNDIPDIPPPSPLRFCGARQLFKLGIEGIAQNYERVAGLYEDSEGSSAESMLAGARR